MELRVAQVNRLRLGLVGYYGYGNYGDELFKEVLTEYFPGAILDVIDVPRLSSDVSYLHKFERECDGIIFGGGDIIIPSDWAPWYFSEHLLTKPIFFFGVGVPLWAGVNTDAVRKLAEYLAHPNVRFIAVRDEESRSWIRDFLCPPRSVLTFADMIFALPVPHVTKPKDAPILTVITRDQPPGEIHWTNIEALCDRARSYGYEIRNLILGTEATRADDLKILDVEHPNIKWDLVQSDSLEALTRFLAESTVVASMKFHGCVVASLCGIPAITLSTTDKFNNFLRVIERPDLRSHHTHFDLADHLPRFLAPIPTHTVNFLRQNAIGGLGALRASLQETFNGRLLT